MNTPPDELIEDALRTYPLAQVPPGFSAGVMRQIQTPRPAPKFRLTWLDYALGIFLCMLPGIGLVSLAFVPWQVFTGLQHQLLLLSSPAFVPMLIGLLLAAAVLAGLVAIAGLRFLLQPQVKWVFK
ncbi:MAG TPA: hypothetical protein VGK00_14440 [Anaerolineales bacterium]|jgi:hypothetical protein